MITVMEQQSLDMSALLLQAYEVGDMIKGSADLADYLYWKKRVEQDEAAQQLIRKLDKKKQLFEECERFGHYHPNYHEALDQVNAVQAEMDAVESIRKFKEAEDKLDSLLFSISSMIAGSVSDSIKVPGNTMQIGGGCSTGGSCSGKCG